MMRIKIARVILGPTIYIRLPKILLCLLWLTRICASPTRRLSLRREFIKLSPALRQKSLCHKEAQKAQIRFLILGILCLFVAEILAHPSFQYSVTN